MPGRHGGKSNSLLLAILGNVQQALGNYTLAEKYYREGINASKDASTFSPGYTITLQAFSN